MSDTPPPSEPLPPFRHLDRYSPTPSSPHPTSSSSLPFIPTIRPILSPAEMADTSRRTYSAPDTLIRHLHEIHLQRTASSAHPPPRFHLWQPPTDAKNSRKSRPVSFSTPPTPSQPPFPTQQPPLPLSPLLDEGIPLGGLPSSVHTSNIPQTPKEPSRDFSSQAFFAVPSSRKRKRVEDNGDDGHLTETVNISSSSSSSISVQSTTSPLLNSPVMHSPVTSPSQVPDARAEEADDGRATRVRGDQRIRHNTTEQKRRDRLRDGFEQLRSVLPSKDKDAKMSKLTILNQAYQYINTLQELSNKLISENQEAKESRAALVQQLQQLSQYYEQQQAYRPEQSPLSQQLPIAQSPLPQYAPPTRGYAPGVDQGQIYRGPTQ